MPILSVSITARAPLVFSERRPDGQFRQSTPYVPGAVIRGALAQQFIDSGAGDSEEFQLLFIKKDPPLFRNAYPVVTIEGTNGASWAPSRPVPATAYSCKADGGFKGQTGSKTHGVFDGLIDRLCCEQLGVTIPYLPRCNHAAHKGKGERVEVYVGFYANAPSGKCRSIVTSQLTTRVAINRNRKVAEERMLYSPLVISETTENGYPTGFQGSISVHGAGEAIVRNRLAELTHIGSGAARGFGHVEVKVASSVAENLDERVKSFNQAIARRWQLWQQLSHNFDPCCAPDKGTFFSIMLISDAILRDGNWSPTVRLEPSMLGSAGRNATLLRCYATAEYRGGWNTAWGLPKDTELIARMGSVYVFHTSDQIDDGAWRNSLRHLETYGVGDRRVEGYGEVRVCDEFHQEIQEVK